MKFSCLRLGVFLFVTSFSHSFAESSNACLPTHDSIYSLRQATQARSALANQILRNRLTQFVETEVKERIAAILSHHSPLSEKTLNRIKNQLAKNHQVSLFQGESPKSSGTPKTPGSITFSVNLKEDHSKLEYVEDNFEVGIHQNRTLATLRGLSQFSDSLVINLNKKWTESALRASLNVPWTLPFYQFSVSHDFSPKLSSTLLARAPLKRSDSVTRFEVQFGIAF